MGACVTQLKPFQTIKVQHVALLLAVVALAPAFRSVAQGVGVWYEARMGLYLVSFAVAMWCSFALIRVMGAAANAGASLRGANAPVSGAFPWALWLLGLALGVAAWTAEYGYYMGVTGGGGLYLVWFAGVWFWANAQRSGGLGARPYRAHFAARAEIAPLVTTYSAPDIGHALLLAELPGNREDDRPLLALQAGATGGRRELGHALIVGPNRSGKGLHLQSQLLTWHGSVVVVDIKGEMFHTTAGERSKSSRVLVLDPNGRGARYDPFKDLASSAESLYAAAELVLEAEKEGANRIFGDRAASALFAALRAAVLEGAPTIQYVDRVVSLGVFGFVQAVMAVRDVWVNRALNVFLGKPPEEFKEEDLRGDRFIASSWVNLQTKMRGFFSEGILNMTSGSDFKATDLLDASTTLYLVFRESDLKFTGRALAIIEMAMMNAIVREYDVNPGRKSLPVLLAFDEAGRVPVPELPNLVSTISGRGMSALVYIQSLSQLEGTYGKDGAATIRDNCHTQIFYRPQDEVTGKYISTKLGMTSILDASGSTSRSSSLPAVTLSPQVQPLPVLDAENETTTVSERWLTRELATVDELRQMSPENVLLFVSELPPIIGMRLKPYVQVDLKGRLGLTPPAVAVLPPAARGRVLHTKNTSAPSSDDEDQPASELIPTQQSSKVEADDWVDPPEDMN
jgi:type IV secretion system protein VirD4